MRYLGAFVADHPGVNRVKRSPSVAAVAGVLVLLTLPLGGCSFFQKDKSSAVSADISGGSTAGDSAAVSTPGGTATPTAPTNAPVPPTVAGYTLTEASPEVQRKFQTVAKQFQGVYSGLTVRNVAKGNETIGTVVLLGLHPQLVGNVQVEQRLVPGMVKGMSGQGAKVATQKINGQDVAVATTASTSIVAWYRKGTVVLMLANGADTEPSLAFSKAYLAVQ